MHVSLNALNVGLQWKRSAIGFAFHFIIAYYFK